MKWLNIVTLLLVIVGGVNWGLVATSGHQMDLVANIFGGDDTVGAKVVYALVGLSALWQIVPWLRTFNSSEPAAEAGARHRVETTR
jgi:uncharacterized membrane protein YuzA (DUF378 family)